MELAHTTEGIYEDTSLWSVEWFEATRLPGSVQGVGTDGCGALRGTMWANCSPCQPGQMPRSGLPVHLGKNTYDGTGAGHSATNQVRFRDGEPKFFT